MSLRINVRERDGVAIIDLGGRIVFGDGDEQVTGAVKELLAEGHKKILINLAKVAKVDSVGLGSLTACYASAEARSARVKLLRPLERLKNLLVITKLITIFDIFEDEEEAVTSFAEETVGTV
jgi:anti-sigma B factor antagonist